MDTEELVTEELVNEELDKEELATAESGHRGADRRGPALTEPFHVPPVQLVAVASCVACSAVLYGLPKMSFSPESVTPSSTSLAVPRAPSRLPVPVESGNSCLAAGVGRLGRHVHVHQAVALAPAARPPAAWSR